jgi:hypothetical protein
MGRGVAFTFSEDEFLIENAETKTAKELYESHEIVRIERMWPERSVKSLARRVERLREVGGLGKRDEETRRKAYYGRRRIRGE